MIVILYNIIHQMYIDFASHFWSQCWLLHFPPLIYLFVLMIANLRIHLKEEKCRNTKEKITFYVILKHKFNNYVIVKKIYYNHTMFNFFFFTFHCLVQAMVAELRSRSLKSGHRHRNVHQNSATVAGIWQPSSDYFVGII